MAGTGIEVVNKAGFLKQVDLFAKRWGKTAEQVGTEQMGLLAKDLIKRTPPKTYKQGRQAVETDIKKVFFAVDSPQMLDAWRKALEESGADIHRTLKSGKVRIDRKKFKAHSVQRLRQIHDSYKNRKGRVKFQYNSKQAWGGRYAVPRADLKRYIQDRQKRVGYSKAGWMAALVKFGGKMPSRFIARHGGARGWAEIKVRRSSITWMVANRVPWVHEFKRVYVGVEKTRQRHMMRLWRQGMRDEAERFSRSKAA